MAYNPKDFYFKKAKEKNFAARSVFKLEEIDERYHILKKGQIVLDLGCAPGSWSQLTSQKIGPTGKILGIDLSKMHISLPNAIFIQGDAFDHTLLTKKAQELGITAFDLVLSDMAPKTTGIRITDQERSYQLCLRALETARHMLKPEGSFIVKIFQGDEFKNFTELVKKEFKRLEIVRPKSVRKESFEIYVLGLGKL